MTVMIMRYWHSSGIEDVENSVRENVPTDELDYEYMEVPYIHINPEILKAMSSNTSQNQSLHALPEVPLDKSVLENVSSPPSCVRLNVKCRAYCRV